MPISRSVAASTALPMVYKPVEIKGRHLVDGGLRSTTNVDVAVEAGATFVIVVNPLVPYVNDFQKVIPTMLGQPRAPRARHGLPADRLPGVQAARPPAAARGGQPLEGALPGRRHHPDRARPERRADVRDEHPQLHPARRDRPARLRVGHAQARLRVRQPQGDLRQARDRDLGHARAQGGRASSPRSASARPAGGASSSRRRPACCASPKTPRPGGPCPGSAARPAPR